MSKHLLVKGLSFAKQPQGEWVVSQIATNQGIFRIGENENALLDPEIVERFCSYISATMREQLEGFLQEEQEEEHARESTGEGS